MNKQLEDAQVRYENSKYHADAWVAIMEKDRKELERLLEAEKKVIKQ